MLDGTELGLGYDPFITAADEVNNARIRRLIEQFNAEEEHEFEARQVRARLLKLSPAPGEKMSGLLDDIERALARCAPKPAIDAVGVWLDRA